MEWKKSFQATKNALEEPIFRCPRETGCSLSGCPSLLVSNGKANSNPSFKCAYNVVRQPHHKNIGNKQAKNTEVVSSNTKSQVVWAIIWITYHRLWDAAIDFQNNSAKYLISDIREKGPMKGFTL